MMRTAAIFLADGFEEIEVVTPCDVLTRGGIRVTIVTLSGSEVRSAHKGLELKADKMLAEIVDDHFDVLLLPGGMPGAKNLAQSAQLSKMLKKQLAEGRWIAAICASPALVLYQGGIINSEIKGVCYPSMGEHMGLSYIADSNITTHVDGKIITSRGPATAMEFSLAIIREIQGEQMASDIAKALLY